MFKKTIIQAIIASFFLTSLGPLPDASAQVLIDLPAPGLMVAKSAPFEPLQLKGILINVKNPLRFDFLIDKGDSRLQGQPLKSDITRLAKYFLTCLTVPENDLWVNLSPYEKDRIVPGNFGITVMGKDLLEQDYLLKQIMASMSYPENQLGRSFWQRVYQKSSEFYGTTNIPISTFNKVWIVPKSAEVYVKGNSAFVVNSKLDVMLEADYLATVKNIRQPGGSPTRGPKVPQGNNHSTNEVASQIMREIILPELRQEVNEGKNFAVVRQVYNAMILATWYKKHLKDSLLGRMYVGRNQVKGVDVADKKIKERIYQQYLQAYKKCVYNYIKEDYDPLTQQTVPRKYVSGGVAFQGFTGMHGTGNVYHETAMSPQENEIGGDLAMATIDIAARNRFGLINVPHDSAMASSMIAAIGRRILPAMALIIAFSAATPAFAFVIKDKGDDTTYEVTINKNDQLGFALLKMKSFAGMPLWGPDGLVAQIKPFVHVTNEKLKIHDEKLANPNLVHPGDKLTVPTKHQLEILQQASLDTPTFELTQAERELFKGYTALVQTDITSFTPVVVKTEKITLDDQPKIRIHLSPSSGVNSYKVYSSPTKEGPFTNEVDSFHGSVYNFPQPSVLTYLEFRAVGAGGELSNYSDFVTITPKFKALELLPSPVPVIVLQPVTGMAFDLQNKILKLPDLPQGADYFVISRRANSNEQWVPLAAGGHVTTKDFPDATAEAGKTYEYDIQAHYTTGLTPFSAAVPASYPKVIIPEPAPSPMLAHPDAPKILSVNAGDSKVDFEFEKQEGTIKGFRSTDGKNFGPITVNIVDGHFIDTNLVNKTTYYYQFQMSKDGLDSVLTAIFNETPQAVSPGPPPPPEENSAIFSFLYAYRLWIGGVVGGVGVVGGAWSLFRKRKNKSIAQAEKPVNVSIEFGSSSVPLPATDEELASLPALRQKLDSLLSSLALQPASRRLVANNPSRTFSPAKLKSRLSGLRAFSILDIGGWLSSMIFTVNVYGYDPVSLIVNAAALPVVNAVYAVTDLVVHEFTHMFVAAGVYVFKRNSWGKIFKPSNLHFNLTSEEWKLYLISKLLGRVYQGRDPYVSIPAYGWGWVISKSGIVATVAANFALFAFSLWFASDHQWLMPFMGIIGTSALSAIKRAWIGDIDGAILNRTTGEKNYFCGISVHSRIKKRKDLLAEGDDVSLQRTAEMMEVESDRGRHEVGVLKMREGPDGKVRTIVTKAVEGKRGPGSNSIEVAMAELKKDLTPINASGALAEEYVMDTDLGHNRLASSGVVVEDAAHPHKAEDYSKVLWSFTGEGGFTEGKGLVPDFDVEVAKPDELEEAQQNSANNDVSEENVNAAAAHNGDNDAYKPLDTDGYIEDLQEFREFVVLLSRFKGKLPPGDSPLIPLLVKFHLTQLNADASVYFAHVRAHHKTNDEIKQDILTEDEEKAAGDVFNRGIRIFHELLSRPALKDPNKTVKDLYVSKQMAKDNPRNELYQYQYAVLEGLRQYLFNAFKREAKAGNLPEKIIQHWRGADADRKIAEFVELAVYKFFTGDRQTATKEVLERLKGTFGLAIKDSTNLNGMTLVSRKMGMTFGYNLEKGYLDASSDPYALIRKYSNGDKLDHIMSLDPSGEGEMANFQVSKKTGKLTLTVYSFKLGRYLTPQEIDDRQDDTEGKYWVPIHEYNDERRATKEDVELISPAIAKIVKSFDESNELKPTEDQDLNYQSGRELFKKFLAMWIDEKIENQLYEGGMYKNIHDHLGYKASLLLDQCQSNGGCSSEELEMLSFESQASAENSFLMPIVLQSLKKYSMGLAQLRVKGAVTQEQLQDLIPKVILRSANEVEAFLNIDNLGTIYKSWDHDRKNPFSGRKKTRVLFFGDENSDDGPRSVEDEWNALFPKLAPTFVPSYEILNYQALPFDITQVDALIATTKGAGNYNTGQAMEIGVNANEKENLWVVTSIPFSPASIILGQRLKKNSPFLGHSFYTGQYLRAQTQGASTSLINSIHLLLPVFLALQFDKYCPGEHPFGLNLTPEKVKYFKLLFKEMMPDDSVRLTGRDAQGRQVSTAVSKALGARASFLTKRLWTSTFVNWLQYLHVAWIFYIGAPISGILELMNVIPGPTLHSLSGFALTTLNYLFTLTAPVLFTIIIRYVTGYNPWVRFLGPPSNITITGKETFPETQKMFLRVVFSRAFASWSSPVDAEPYQKAIAKEGPITARGSWIFGHIPPVGNLKRAAQGAFKQLKVTKTGLFGLTTFFGFKVKRTGGISFTTSRGPYQNQDVSDYNVDIGGTKFLPAINDDDVVRVFNTFDAWGANLANIKVFSDMADQLTFGGKAWKLKKTNNAQSLTTELGQPPPELLPKDFIKLHVGSPDAAMVAGVHLSQSATKGGIDMNSRLMQLTETGDRPRRFDVGDSAMSGNVINAVIPRVSGIVTVTPQMLKTMLGSGYLN